MLAVLMSHPNQSEVEAMKSADILTTTARSPSSHTRLFQEPKTSFREEN
jgi:hypothetical protein